MMPTSCRRSRNLVVAITGASAGIGRACAERLGVEGACVAVSARRGDRLDAVVAAILSTGGRAIAVPGDVTNPADMDALVSQAIAHFGRLDVMICNAGIGFHGTLAESSPEISKQLVDVNVLGIDLRGPRRGPRVHAPESPATSLRCRPLRARAAWPA